MHKNETPYANWIKYRRVLGVLDAIIYINYGHDQWMSFCTLHLALCSKLVLCYFLLQWVASYDGLYAFLTTLHFVF